MYYLLFIHQYIDSIIFIQHTVNTNVILKTSKVVCKDIKFNINLLCNLINRLQLSIKNKQPNLVSQKLSKIILKS